MQRRAILLSPQCGDTTYIMLDKSIYIYIYSGMKNFFQKCVINEFLLLLNVKTEKEGLFVGCGLGN